MLPTAEALPLALFVAVGLLGGAHCLGMCGPLVALYADRTDGRARRQLGLFNVGRTAGYAAVGALAGALGSVITEAAALTPAATAVRATTGIVAGVAIVAAGAAYLRTGTGAAHLPLVDRVTARVTRRVAGRVDDWVDGPAIVGLGAFHALLPCPLLYPAYLYAFARGSPLAGAAALGALGLGTLPLVFLVGTAASLPTGARSHLHRALGAVFVLLGVVPLSHGLALAGAPVPHLPIPIYQPLG